jgi:hypothetical protein
LFWSPVFFAVSVLLLQAAMSSPQTRPPFFLPFPSLPSLLLYSLALSSLSLELWRFPSRVLIAALLLLLLLLLLSADLHFSPTQVSRFFHTTFLWFFAFVYQFFCCCLCDACLFPSCSYSRGKIYVYLCFKNTGVCVCVLCPILIRVQLLSV